MKLLLTIDDYISRNPVYPMKVPKYLEQTEGTTFNDYFQSVVFCTQRLIDNYMQNYFSNREWNLQGIDYKLVEKIKDIIFEEAIYLEQNQLFFVKSNDISYSTAGQQTFTHSVTDDKGNILIPPNVITMIRNTGIMNYAVSGVRNGAIASQAENQFADGFFVPKVRWSDKADNVFSLLGSNVTISGAITNLFNNSVFLTNSDFNYNTKIAKNFVEKDAITLTLKNKYLESSTFFPNKQDTAYAQIKDLKDIYQDIETKTDSNTSKITDLQSLVVELDNDKVSNSAFNSGLASKANLNLNNVNFGKSTVPRYLLADSNGNLIFAVASGDLKISQWSPDKLYLEGEAVYIQYPKDSTKIAIFIASNLDGNLNKNPFIDRNYWYIYTLEFSIADAATIDYVQTNYLNLNGTNSMLTNLNLGGNAIINCVNLLEKSTIVDNQVTDSTLWSSAKIDAEIKTAVKNSKRVKYEIGEVISFVTEAAFIAIANKYGKVEGVDWKRWADAGILVGHGSQGAIQGSNLITKEQLPNIRYNLQIAIAYGASMPDWGWTDTPDVVNAGNARGADREIKGFGPGHQDFHTNWNIFLNGNKAQNQFIPKHKQMFFVEILTTWYEKEEEA